MARLLVALPWSGAAPSGPAAPPLARGALAYSTTLLAHSTNLGLPPTAPAARKALTCSDTRWWWKIQQR